jgi:hypothetical protein
MSNMPRLRDSRRRTGLVEVVTEPGKVNLHLAPPGTPAVTVEMTPEQARGLARGLADGADEAEGVVIVRPQEVTPDATGT